MGGKTTRLVDYLRVRQSLIMRAEVRRLGRLWLAALAIQAPRESLRGVTAKPGALLRCFVQSPHGADSHRKLREQQGRPVLETLGAAIKMPPDWGQGVFAIGNE
jgi:hypothetical protein